MNRGVLVRLLAATAAVALVVACDDDPVQPELTQPTGVTAVQQGAAGTSIRLSWTAVPTATGYVIQRAPGATGGTFAGVGGGTITGTTFTDNVTAPGTFRYRIAAVRGNDTSTFATVTATTAETFTASLSGDAERPTQRTTPATGSATVTHRNDSLVWTVTLSNITNVTAGHIHHGVVDSAGGVIRTLSPASCAGGACNAGFQGFVVRAGYTPEGGVGFDSLLVLMRAGRTYVNVHTNDGDATINEGPGDFPQGEVRGQLARQNPAPLTARRRRG